MNASADLRQAVDMAAFSAADFARPLRGARGVRLEGDSLHLKLRAHQYVWLTDHNRLHAQIFRHAGSRVELAARAEVQGSATVSVWLGLHRGGSWHDSSIRLGQRACIDVPADVEAVRLGVRLAGEGRIDELVIEMVAPVEADRFSRPAMLQSSPDLLASAEAMRDLLGRLVWPFVESTWSAATLGRAYDLPVQGRFAPLRPTPLSLTAHVEASTDYSLDVEFAPEHCLASAREVLVGFTFEDATGATIRQLPPDMLMCDAFGYHMYMRPMPRWPGWGTVQFTTPSQAATARLSFCLVQCNRSLMLGRTIRLVDLAERLSARRAHQALASLL